MNEVSSYKIKIANNDSLKIALAYYDYGQYLDVNGEKDASIKNLKIALQIAKQLKNDEKIAAIGKGIHRFL